MYELIILSLLMREPLHGYLIVKITNDQIGPWARISSGTLYPILARLEQTGLIAALPSAGADARGERRARTFAITEEGRKRFHQVMMDTSSNLGDYQKLFRYKTVYLDLLHPRERLLLLNHYINYCQTSILHLQTEMQSLAHELADYPNPTYLGNALGVMRHLERQWEAELAWTRDMRARELASAADASERAGPPATDQGEA